MSSFVTHLTSYNGSNDNDGEGSPRATAIFNDHTSKITTNKDLDSQNVRLPNTSVIQNPQKFIKMSHKKKSKSYSIKPQGNLPAPEPDQYLSNQLKPGQQPYPNSSQALVSTKLPTDKKQV